MSKPVSIAVGKQSRSFSDVKYLYTRNAGSDYSAGFTRWVPEDEVELTNKTITENGTYYAEDDGVYGWDTINVSVASDPSAPGSTVIGTDPADGEEYAVVVDEDGELEKTKLPVSIAVTTPPTKTEYEDGETINPTGIIVHAYYADDTDYGTVLNSELSYEPTEADGSGSSGEGIYSGGGINAVLVTMGPYHYQTKDSYSSPVVDRTTYVCPDSYGTHEGKPVYMTSDTGQSLLLTQYNGYVYGVCVSGTANTLGFSAHRQPTEDNTSIYTLVIGSNIRAQYNTFGRMSEEETFFHGFPESDVDPTGVDPGSLSPSGGVQQTITVKWPRIIDRKVLTSSFDITVQAGISDLSHESGSF